MSYNLKKTPCEQVTKIIPPVTEKSTKKDTVGQQSNTSTSMVLDLFVNNGICRRKLFKGDQDKTFVEKGSIKGKSEYFQKINFIEI